MEKHHTGFLAFLIILFLLFLAGDIIMFVLAFYYYPNELKKCENKESPACYEIQCPCDTFSDLPCKGYAKRSDGNGNWICSYAQNSIVDSQGNPV